MEAETQTNRLFYCGKHGSVLKSITADILDQGLLQFTTEANRKRGYRMLDMILHQDPPTDPSLYQPVFVLPSERQKFSTIEALAVADIDNMILDIIESLGDDQEVYLNLFNKLQRGRPKKAQHIEFLQLMSNVSKDTTQVENDGFLSGADAEI